MTGCGWGGGRGPGFYDWGWGGSWDRSAPVKSAERHYQGCRRRPPQTSRLRPRLKRPRSRRRLPDPRRAARDRPGSVWGCGGNAGRVLFSEDQAEEKRQRDRPASRALRSGRGLRGSSAVVPRPCPRVPGRRIRDLARAARLLLRVWQRALWRGDLSLFLLRRGSYRKGTCAL